ELGKLSGVPEVDFHELLDFLRVLKVMRQVVMSLRDANFREGTIVAIVAQHDGGDARAIGLEGQHQHVQHDLGVLRAILRDPLGSLDSWIFDRASEVLGLLESSFDLADTREVLVELVAIASAQPAIHAAGVFEHKIEHGPLLLLATTQVLCAFAGSARTEESLEEQAGIGLGGDRGGGGTPGKIELISASVTGIAGARSANGIAAQFE